MSKHSKAKEKAQAFFAKKNEEKQGKDTKDSDEKKTDTSKMPEGLRKYFEKKQGK